MTTKIKLSKLIARAAVLSREDHETRHIFLNDVAMFLREHGEFAEYESRFVEDFLLDASTGGNIDGSALHAFLSGITPPRE